MAEYVQPNIRVSISEDCFEKAYYIHFGRFICDKKTQNITGIIFDKRYKIDESKYNNYYPKLCLNSTYYKDQLALNTNDSFLGSKITNNDHTIVSMIYPNEFFDLSNMDYLYRIAIITGISTEEIPKMNVPYSISYNINNINNSSNLIKLVSEFITSYDNTKWLYIIDGQNIVNQYCSYIAHFYIDSTESDQSIENITIKLHTIQDEAHLSDISNYANNIETSKVFSDFVIKNNMNTTFSKMNGLLTANPLQHRLQFYGTPYGYRVADFDFVTQELLNKLLTDKNNFKHKLIEKIDKLLYDTDPNGIYFGNKLDFKLFDDVEETNQ